MECFKCGSENIDDKFKCLDCGYNNIKFGKHIDIEEYNPQVKHYHNFEKARKVVIKLIFFIILVLISFFLTILVYIFKDKSNQNLLNTYSTLKTNSNLYVIYFGNNENYNKLIDKYQKYYDFDYLKINDNKLTKKNKRFFKNELLLKKLKNNLVVVKDKKISSKGIITSKEDINNILNKGKAIPNTIENPLKEIEKLDLLLTSEAPSLIYIAFANNDLVTDKSETLKNLCANYKINFEFIRGYIFSDKQIMKYMNQFGFTEKKNELILLIENKKITKVIDHNYLNTDDYVEIFQNYDIINSISNYLNNIEFLEFLNIIDNKNKEVIVFGNDNCTYCKNIKYLLGNISKNNNIIINYLNITENNQLENKLKELNYNGTITYPFTIVVENNQVLDYVIGLADSEYFEEFFKRLGIIR